MKWLTLAGILLCLSRHSEAGALKCTPGSQEPSCASEKRERLAVQSPELENETVSVETECLAGSEWESNCHYCRCSDSGIAECLKQNSCDVEVFEEPIKCKPYTTFKRDCSTCTCLMDGLGLCTLIDCPPSERRKREMQCQPGSTWQSDCNTCICESNGIPSCTRKECYSGSIKREMQCQPGSTWQSDCNACICESNGIPSCTRKECYTGSISSNVEKRDTSKTAIKAAPNHAREKRSVCKPNQEFQVDCNACKCAANGQSYTCTHNECLEGDATNKEVEVFMESGGTDHIERHSVCKPRDTFYIGCNTCHCNPYGTDYSCTNKPCPLPKDVELFHELKAITTTSSNNTKQVVCVANRMFIMDCNTCWCNEDGTSFFCTRRVCIPDSIEENGTKDPASEVKLKTVEQQCRPIEFFEMDCNMCRCSDDGKSFSCTRRACVELDDKNATLVRKTRDAQETAKACQPGAEFRMDCNKCLCNDEGQDFSCTRIDCAALNNNGGGDTIRTKRDTTEEISTKCVPGSVFDRECNACRCTDDGLHAVCALKLCKRDNVDKEPETTPSFRCTPGDQFKRECNDCTCSADGKGVFCTLRLCDQ